MVTLKEFYTQTFAGLIAVTEAGRKIRYHEEKDCYEYFDSDDDEWWEIIDNNCVHDVVRFEKANPHKEGTYHWAKIAFENGQKVFRIRTDGFRYEPGSAIDSWDSFLFLSEDFEALNWQIVNQTSNNELPFDDSLQSVPGTYEWAMTFFNVYSYPYLRHSNDMEIEIRFKEKMPKKTKETATGWQKFIHCTWFPKQ